MNSLLTESVLILYHALDGKARLVGGCVRDFLLSRPCQDIDMATPLTPQEVTDKLTRNKIQVIPTGIAHGTVSALINETTYEITSLRRDTCTDGRHAVVSFGTSYAEDAQRRDFTINALYMDINGQIEDYTGGLEDLKNHIVRFIGSPADRIQEDYLRILRYFRFWSEISTTLPDDTLLTTIQTHAAGLKKISDDRKRTELLKLLMTPKADQALLLMRQTDILNDILPNTDIDLFQRFINQFPQAGIWERLSILTQGVVPKTLKLSRAQIKYLSGLTQFQLTDSLIENKLIKSLVSPSVFNFLIQKAILMHTLSTPVLNALTQFTPPPFTITGADMLKLGIPAGAKIQDALKVCRQIWAQQGFPNTMGSILKAFKHRTSFNQGEKDETGQ